MTFIQPNKQKGLSLKILILLITPLFIGVLWLVALYNQNVNLSYEISKTRLEVEKTQASLAQMKNEIFTRFDSASIEKVISERQLIQDKNPEYFVSQKWEFASR